MDYILDDHFLECVLSEEVKPINKKIFEVEISENKSVLDIPDLLDFMESTSLSDTTKTILLDRIYEAYFGEIEVLDQETLLEFSGNESKNREYAKAMKDIEEVSYYIKSQMDRTFKLGDDIIDILKNTKEETGAVNESCKKINKLFDEYVAKLNDKNIDSKYNKFMKLSKSFNNKFSDANIPNKRILDDKLDKLIAELYGKDIQEWIRFSQLYNKTPKFDALNNEYYRLKHLPEDDGKELSIITNQYIKYLSSIWKASIKFYYNIRVALNLDIDDKFSWKIVHKIFK